MRVCCECGIEKPLSEFIKDKTNAIGIRYECKVCTRARQKKQRAKILKERGVSYSTLWRRKHPEKSRQIDKKFELKRRYNLTVEEAEEIYSRGCEICGVTQSLCIDHCHETGKIRGCLCNLCNTLLGKYQKLEKNGLLEKFLEYSKR